MQFWIFMAILAFKATLAIKDPDRAVTCEPMKIDLCQTKDFYNVTGFPNLAGHKVQADAGEQLKTWIPLVETKCDPNLQLFLCTVHVPMCSMQSDQKLIGPCKPFCEMVRCLSNIYLFFFQMNTSEDFILFT